MMDVTQKQCLLSFLGFYPARQIDGIWGPESEKATRAFQTKYGLTADGIFGPAAQEKARQIVGTGEMPREDREDWWEDMEYFSPEEFRCKCGGKYCNGFPARMQKDAVWIAEMARRQFGRPGHVVSGLRCRQHNANSGGVSNSQHMYGEAVDLRIEGVSGAALLDYVRKLPQVRYAYQINSTNVHFDIPKGAR